MLRIVELKLKKVLCTTQVQRRNTGGVIKDEKKIGWVAELSDGSFYGDYSIRRPNGRINTTIPAFRSRKKLLAAIEKELGLTASRKQNSYKYKRDDFHGLLAQLTSRTKSKESLEKVSLITDFYEEKEKEIKKKEKQLENLVLDNKIMIGFRNRIKDAAISGGWTDDHELTAFEFIETRMKQI